MKKKICLGWTRVECISLYSFASSKMDVYFCQSGCNVFSVISLYMYLKRRMHVSTEYYLKGMWARYIFHHCGAPANNNAAFCCIYLRWKEWNVFPIIILYLQRRTHVPIKYIYTLKQNPGNFYYELRCWEIRKSAWSLPQNPGESAALNLFCFIEYNNLFRTKYHSIIDILVRHLNARATFLQH